MTTLKAKEIAVILKIPVKAVYKLIHSKRLPGFRLGRSLRVLEADLQDFLGVQRQKGAQYE